MNKKKKITIIIATACLVVGLIIIGGLQLSGAEYTSLYFADGGWQTAESMYQTITHNEPVEPFKNMSIELSYGQLELVPGRENKVEFTGVGSPKKFVCTVEGDTLTVKVPSAGSNTISFGVGVMSDTSESKLVVHYDASKTYDKVALSLNTSTAQLGEMSLQQLAISQEYGKLLLDDITADHIELDLETVTTNGNNLTADSFVYHSEYGNTIFEAVDTNKLQLQQDSGSFRATFLKAQQGEIKATYGRLDFLDATLQNITYEAETVDAVFSGNITGTNSFHAEYGKLNILSALPQEDYNIILDTQYTNPVVNGNKVADGWEYHGEGDNTLTIAAESIRLLLEFEQ